MTLARKPSFCDASDVGDTSRGPPESQRIEQPWKIDIPEKFRFLTKLFRCGGSALRVTTGNLNFFMQ
jgi:hypothetical protein